MRTYRRLCGILTLAAVLVCIAAPLFADGLTNYGEWSHAYMLTPLEHKRLRAKGFGDAEVFAIANVTNFTGRHVDDITQAALRGNLTELTVRQYGVDPSILRERRPEWLTPAWQEAVKRGDYIFVAPRQ
jgi:hypothetical protein